MQNAAPLFCAGITLYSPLRHWNAGPGKRVAIVGFGGLGHVGVQISKALGAHTTVLDLSPAKRDDALRLGADEFRIASDAGDVHRPCQFVRPHHLDGARERRPRCLPRPAREGRYASST